MRTRTHRRWTGGIGAVAVLVAVAAGVAPAESAQATDADLCAVTPDDGSWGQGAFSADLALTVSGFPPHEVRVTGASAACVNTQPHVDGTTFDVAVYLFPSETEAGEALQRLRSEAAAVAVVEDLAGAGLGERAWIARFDVDQLAFTQIGPYLIGGHSNEAYGDSRDTYTRILIERMSIAYSRLFEPPPPPPADAPSCAPQGVVTDHDGEPMPGLRLQLLLEDQVADQRVTDAAGWYQFADIGSLAEAFAFDAGRNRYAVAVELRDAVEGEARFEIRWGSEGILPLIRRGPYLVADDPACVVDFNLGAVDDEYSVIRGPSDPDEWRGLAFAYQGIRRAHLFAGETLWTEFGPGALPVFVYCDGSPPGVFGAECSGGKTAFFIGASSADPEPPGGRFIALTRSWSARLDSPQRPVNSEYHEVGHALLHDTFGSTPTRAGESNHAGYGNPSSTDSWNEGFAEWFATQVSRHIDGNPRWWVYPGGNQWVSLEDDRRVAENGGGDEEYAIAGILVDMVDGDADYSAPTARRLTVTAERVIRNPDPSARRIHAVEATIRNDGPIPLRDVAVTGSFGRIYPTRVDGIVDPAVLDPGATGRAVIPVPAGADPTQVAIEIVGYGVDDDDDVTHSAAEVWEAITAYRGPLGNGRVMDASQLREALLARFPDESAAIDEIFVAHGIFADVDPRNGLHEPSEAIGVTSPDGVTIRTDAEAAPVYRASIATGGTASRTFVQVLYPEPRDGLSYGYPAEPDPQRGTVSIAVPPAETGAIVRIVVSADGYLPVVLPDIDAAAFWEEAGLHDFEPFFTAAVPMARDDGTETAVDEGTPSAGESPPPDDPVAAPLSGSDGGDTAPLGVVLMVAGAAVALVVIFRWRTSSRTTAGAAAVAGDVPPPPPPDDVV